MWSVSEEGSYLRFIDFCSHVSLNSRLESNKEEDEGLVLGLDLEGIGRVDVTRRGDHACCQPSPSLLPHLIGGSWFRIEASGSRV